MNAALLALYLHLNPGADPLGAHDFVCRVSDENGAGCTAVCISEKLGAEVDCACTKGQENTCTCCADDGWCASGKNTICPE